MRRHNVTRIRRAPIELEELDRRDLPSAFSGGLAFGNPDDRIARPTTAQVAAASSIGNPGLRPTLIAVA